MTYSNVETSIYKLCAIFSIDSNGFNLADEACEEALYDIEAFGDFCGVALGREGVTNAAA